MSAIAERFRLTKDDRPWLEFAAKIIVIYGGWKLFQYIVNHTASLDAWWTLWTDRYAHKIATLINKVLVSMGYDVSFDYYKAVYPLGTPGFMVEEHCLAIPATLIFGAFIAVYRGPWKHKLWYIPLGMIAVQMINNVRILGLSLLLKHVPPRYFQFNHSVTALIFTYGLIFLMVWWWMRRYYHMEPSRKHAKNAS